MKRLYYKFKRISSFFYHLIRTLRYILPFTLVLALCIPAFALNYEYDSISDIGEIYFTGAVTGVGQRSYYAGDYDPDSLAYNSCTVTTGTTDGQEYYTVTRDLNTPGSNSFQCLRVRYDLNSKLSVPVSPADVFIYNGYFYLLSIDSSDTNMTRYEQENGLENNLKNMYFNIYGYKDGNVNVSYRVPLAPYIKESGFQIFGDHSHSYFNLSVKYEFTSDFTITGFSFDFNGCQPYDTVTVTAYPTADWSSGNATPKPIQLYIGSASSAPQYVLPDDSIINDYNQAEDELLNKFDSNSSLDTFASILPDTLLTFANGLGAVTTLFNEFLISFPYVTYLLQISLAFGIFAFIFSVAQSVARRLSRDSSARVKR